MDKCKKTAAYRDKKESPLMQKETSQSLREMTEKLTSLSEGLNGGLLAGELRDAIYILKTQRLRSTGNAHTFRALGGLAALLQLVHRCRECRGRDMVLLLGTLGNLCALERETRSTVSIQIESILCLTSPNVSCIERHTLYPLSFFQVVKDVLPDLSK